MSNPSSHLPLPLKRVCYRSMPLWGAALANGRVESAVLIEVEVAPVCNYDCSELSLQACTRVLCHGDPTLMPCLVLPLSILRYCHRKRRCVGARFLLYAHAQQKEVISMPKFTLLMYGGKVGDSWYKGNVRRSRDVQNANRKLSNQQATC